MQIERALNSCEFANNLLKTHRYLKQIILTLKEILMGYKLNIPYEGITTSIL